MVFKSRADGEARSATIPRESGIPTGAGSRGAGGAALCFIPPQPARILSRTFSSAPPSPAPRARPLGCAPRSPGPRAATQRPREAQRVYFRRHHDPQACEKPGSVRSPRPAPRDVLSLSTAFPAKPSRRSVGSSEDAPPSLHPCSHRWIAAWSGEERLG